MCCRCWSTRPPHAPSGPAGSAVGAFGRFSTANGDRFEVLGVVGDVRNNGLNKPPEPEIYFSANAIRGQPDERHRPVGAADRSADCGRAPHHQAGRSDAGDERRGDDERRRQRHAPARASELAGDDLLRPGRPAHGDARNLRRDVVLRPAAHRGAGHADGPRRRQPRSRGARPGRRSEALSWRAWPSGPIALVGGVWLLVRVLDVADIELGSIRGVRRRWSPSSPTAAASVPAWRTTLLSPMVAIREQPPSVWRLARQRMQRAVRDIRQAVGGDDRPIGHFGGRRADGLRRRRAQRRLVHRGTGRRARGHLRRARASKRRRSSSDATARSRTIAALSPSAALEANAPVDCRRRFPDHPAATLSLAAAVCDRMNWLRSPTGPRSTARIGSTRFGRLPPPASAWPFRCARGSEILGVLLLGARPHRAGFSAHEKQVLRAGADQFALMIENARLTDRVVEQETLRRDIALASDVQRRLLPDAPPRCRTRRFRRRQCAGPAHRRRLLRLRRTARRRNRHRAGRRVGKRRRRRADHVRGAGVAADHLVGGRRPAATARRAHESVRLPVDAREQVRDLLLRAARRRVPATALRQRRPQPAVSPAFGPAIDRRCPRRRSSNCRSEEPSSACFRR